MLVIGYFLPAEKAYKEVYTKQVNIEPWEYVKHTSLLIATISVGMYIFLASNVPPVVMYAFYTLLAFSLVYCLHGMLKNNNRAAREKMAQV